jgi:hypothetical protein
VTVKAVVFDYKTLFSHQAAVTAEMQAVLWWAKGCGLRICILTTDAMDTNARCAQHGYPAPDLHVQQADIPGRKNRGSPAWIDVVTSGLAVANHDLLYVGSTSMDWRTAINSGVFYFHAKWCGPNRDTCIVIESPRDIAGHITQYLMPGPRFSFRYDDPARKLALRSLLPASATLPASPPTGSFKLQDVFTYHRTIGVGQSKASDMLTFHAISSLYVEGMLPKGSLFLRLSQQQSRQAERGTRAVRQARSLPGPWLLQGRPPGTGGRGTGHQSGALERKTSGTPVAGVHRESDPHSPPWREVSR